MMPFVVISLLLSGSPAASPNATLVDDKDFAPTGNIEVDACRRAFEEKLLEPKHARRALVGRCAVSFKQAACAKAIRDASGKQDSRWPSEARRVCCDAYVRLFEAAHFLDRTELCDDSLPITDQDAATHAWFDFAQGAFMLDWHMSTAAAMMFAKRFADSFVPDPLDLPEDVKNPTIRVEIALLKIAANTPLVALINDPRTPMPGKVEIKGTNPEAWEPLTNAVRAIAPKLRVVLSLSKDASKADVQQAQAALTKAGISTTVE